MKNLKYAALLLLSSLAIASGFYQPIPGGLPPIGAAGGDLSGTYPNPTLAVDRVRNVGDTMTGPLLIGVTSDQNLVLNRTGTDGALLSARRNGIEVGSISGTTTAVQFAAEGDATYQLVTGGTARLSVTSAGAVTVNGAGNWPFVQRAGDTMTGRLGLDYTGANVNTALILNGSRQVVSSPVTDTELSYLQGATGNIQNQINNISGVTAAYVLLAGDTMTGGLQTTSLKIGAASSILTNTSNQNGVQPTNAITDEFEPSLQLQSVTASNLRVKFFSNHIPSAQAGLYSANDDASDLTYLFGHNGQDIARMGSSGGIEFPGTTAGSSMAIGANAGAAADIYTVLSGGANPTSGRHFHQINGGGSLAVKLGMAGSAPSDTQLWIAADKGYLSGLSTAVRVGVANGVTSYVEFAAANMEIGHGVIKTPASTVLEVQPGSNFRVTATGVTVNTAAIFDASKNLVSSVVTSTELGYVSGVTAAIQPQLNALINVSVATPGDANYSILAADRIVRTGVTLTTVRTYTLPACTGSNVGEIHYIKKSVSAGSNLSLALSGADTLDGASGPFTMTGQDSYNVFCAANTAWENL